MQLTLTCPRCQTKLIADDSFLDLVTCPRCLASVPVTAPTSPPDAKRPPRVIPLDRQVRDDARLANVTIVVLGGLAFLGIVYMIGGLQLGGMPAAIIISILLIGAIGAWVIGTQKEEPQDWIEPEPPPRHEQWLPSGVQQIEPLSYRTPPRQPPRARTPAFLQGLAGFGTWAIGIIMLVLAINDPSMAVAMRSMGLSQPQFLLFCIIGLLVVFVTLAVLFWIKLHWHAFLPGMLIGFGLTCLVPVGIVLVVCGGGFK